MVRKRLDPSAGQIVTVSRRVERGSFTQALDCPTRLTEGHSPSCQARAVYTQLPEMMWESCYAFSPNSVSNIRYTSDSNGQGVHEGAPVSNEPFCWVGASGDQHCRPPPPPE